VVGLSGFEPLTSRLSGVRSNQLSYRPCQRTRRGSLKTGSRVPDRSTSVEAAVIRRLGSVRKEVIQPQVLLRLPCYDFTPIADHTFDSCLPKVGPPASGATDFRDVTGGVYKARERIHRAILMRDY
jgi:hypothetical protein